VRRHRQGSPDPSIDGCASRHATRRRLPALMALAVAMLVAAFTAAPAQAAPGYAPTAEFGSELPFFAFESTGPRIAVDEVTGDVVVAPYGGNFGASGIFVYSASGALMTQIEPGSLDAGGIAIDQSNGDLYVADVPGGRVLRYTTDRASPPTYTLDGSYNGPVEGPDHAAGQIGSLLSALAIDPTNHDLLVADSRGLQVDRYGPDGSFIGSFGGSGTEAGPFPTLLDLAVGPTGSIYVVQNGVATVEGGAYAGPISGSRVTRFSADGSAGASIAEGESFTEARAVGVDPANGQIAVVTGGRHPLALWTFTTDGALASTVAFPESVRAGGTAGVAIDPSSGRLYSATGSTFQGGSNSVQVFAPRVVPTVTIAAPSNLTPFAAHLQGAVTPAGKITSYYFEYSSDGGATWGRTATQATLSGEEARVDVSADLVLEPRRSYMVRLFAEDGESTNLTLPLNFSSPVAPPAVETGPTVEVEARRVHLEGKINPEGAQATYHFEYGTTASYGASAPVPGGTAGTGRELVPVGIDISDLVPGTLYHYRLAASGPGGDSAGQDRTFETSEVEAAQRGFELVSPLDKGNVSVEVLHNTGLASEDGNSMFFSTEKASYPGAQSTPFIPRVSATRTSQGWKNTSTDPPGFNEVRGQNAIVGTYAVSADQTRALVVSRSALAPGAVSGQPNMYIRNLRADTYTLIATGALGDGGGEFDQIFGSSWQYQYIGSSPDLSTVAFMGGINVTGPNYSQPEAVSSTNIYEWNEHLGLSLVSILPNGSPVTGITSSSDPFLKEPNQVSDNGSRIYFSIVQNYPGQGLYLREDGSTVAVSVSHRPGDSEVPVPSELAQASADGRYAIFTTYRGEGKVPPLTSDAPEHGESVAYRYDAATDDLTFLANRVEPLAAFPQSGNLYYRKTEGGTGLGHLQLFFEHEGVSTRIATEDGTAIRFWRASPSGRYFSFISTAELTATATGGVEELYLYDSKTGQLSCPSCRTDGRVPTGPARIGQENVGKAGAQRHSARAVLDDGTVFFDTPDSLVPRDSNGERDVYSYRDGFVTLISRGSQPGASEFVEATPDGSDVFFTTSQRLVSQDTDSATDLYDARIGGGFTSVESSHTAGCDIQCSPKASPPVPQVIASAVTGGTSKPVAHKPKKKSRRCQKKKADKKGKTSRSQCRKQRGGADHQRNRDADTKKHGKKGAGR
jgi:hypothetical protein